MTLRPRDRIALVVVLLVGLVGAYYMLALKPEQQKAASLNASIASQRQALAQAQHDYTAGRAAQASLASGSAEWAALRIAVPNQSNIPALLRILDKSADSVKVQMQAVQLPGASGSSSTTPAAGATASSASGAKGVPVQLTFDGGYNALNKLVHKIDSLVVMAGGAVHASGPLMSISNVSLSGAPHLSVQLDATIYQLSAAVTPPSATPGG